MLDRSQLLTELRLPESMNLDQLSISEALKVMHEQDLRAVRAVGEQIEAISKAVEIAVEQFKKGGRLFYVGAGTSGRLGVLDASECPPTYRCDPKMIQGIIAGGPDAVFWSKEGAEDSADDGAKEMDERGVNKNDVILGIATGGTTPFVHGALRRARQLGARTIFLSCVQPVKGEPEVDVVIRPLTGPEVVTGSTRMKAGTATKLVLNMISTMSMVQLGKVYENLMVDMRASNAKLRDRAARIVSALTELSHDDAIALLNRADGHVKLAVVMHHRKTDAANAESLLTRAAGNLRAALQSHPL